MTERCRYCEEQDGHPGDVVPVLDKKIERAPTAGNKYRTRCLRCGRWLPMTSEEAYRDHNQPHVLPLDADADDRDGIVPLDEYDYGPEWRDLAQRVGAGAPADNDPEPRDPDGEAEPATERKPRDPDGEAEPAVVNVFDCPACGVEQRGKPDNCPDCGAAYNW